jgi:hypothetical protein
MSLVEQRGVPTVSIVSGGFEEAWRRSAAAYGLATLPMVVIPRVITNQPAADIDAMVDASMEELISSLAEPVEAGPVIEELVPQAETIDIKGDDLLDAFHRMNGLFLEYEWSDGLPLVPPAPELVERMLKATGRDPQEVVAVLEPPFGLATVEKIAINAAMAGCKPEHLPVLIAAVQAIASPPFMMRDAAVSTGSRSPLLVVNGPIAKRLGLNSGACALGPGAPSYANTVIGRALRPIYMNIAGVYAGKTDPNTTGLPTKYSLCVAENEDASPWDPYHVEMGFDCDVSTVTVKTVYGCTETHDNKSTAPEMLADLGVEAARYIGSAGIATWLLGGTADPDTKLEVNSQQVWLMCPDHARLMADAGWSKQDLKSYLYQHATQPVKELLSRKEIVRDSHGNWTQRAELQWLENYPDLQVPTASSPESFIIVVVGGPGPRGVYFWGNEEAVTVPIDE